MRALRRLLCREPAPSRPEIVEPKGVRIRVEGHPVQTPVLRYHDWDERSGTHRWLAVMQWPRGSMPLCTLEFDELPPRTKILLSVEWV